MDTKTASIWLWIAACAPLAGIIGCAIVTSGAKGDSMASGIGGFFQGLIALTFICLVGEAAAIVACNRGDNPQWLAFLMTVLNGIFLLPGLWVLIRMDWS